MSNITKYIFLSLALAFSVVIFTPKASAAFDPFKDTCDGSQASNESAVCKDKNFNVGQSPVDPANGIIPKVANIIAAVGGVIAVVFIMINGVSLLTSTGDSAKVNKARDGLIYASVGIVVIIMARAIVAFIMRFI